MLHKGLPAALKGLIIGCLLTGTLYGHSGRTDSSGGHHNRKTGTYHYHNSGSSSRGNSARYTPRTSYRTSAKTSYRTTYRKPPQSDRFSYKILGTTKVGTQTRYRIQLVPQTASTPTEVDLRKIANKLEGKNFSATFFLPGTEQGPVACGSVRKSSERGLEIHLIDQPPKSATQISPKPQTTLPSLAEQESKRKEHEFRTWTDNTGEFTIEARFRSYGAGKLTLEKKDGSRITLPMERLGTEDQEWVKRLKR